MLFGKGRICVSWKEISTYWFPLNGKHWKKQQFSKIDFKNSDPLTGWQIMTLKNAGEMFCSNYDVPLQKFKKMCFETKGCTAEILLPFFLPLETLPNYDFLCILQSKDKEIISVYQKFSVQLHQFVFTCWRHNGACEKIYFSDILKKIMF